MTYDDILVLIGDFGRYERRTCLLLFLGILPSAFHTMAGVFLGAQPDFRCLLPFESSENATYQLPTDIMNAAYPWDNAAGSWSQCVRYDLNFTDQILDGNGSLITADIIECDAFVYDKTTYALTSTTEFNLVCNSAWLKATADSLLMVGNMLGALLFGGLSDMYGRKSMYCLTIIINIVTGFLVAASPEAISYIVFRLMLGISLNAMYLTSYVNAVEIVTPKKRMMMGVGMQVCFSLGYLLVTGFAYFLTNWRILQIAVTIPSLVFLTYWWIIPESPRWLLSKGRVQEAKDLILKASSVNGVALSDNTLDRMLNSYSSKLPLDLKKASVLDLFRYPNLRRKSLLLFFNWFMNNATYYGLSWNTSSLGGNDYVNFALAAFVELPAGAIVFFTVNRWGRKMILCGCMMLAGVSLLVIIFVPTDMQWLVIVLAMIGKMAITASYEVVYIFSAEQYPTVIRNVGVGACSTFARIGGILSPYVLYLSSVWTPLPYLIFGSGSLIAGLTALLLPETLNEKLPESIEDGETFGKYVFNNNGYSVRRRKIELYRDLFFIKIYPVMEVQLVKT